MSSLPSKKISLNPYQRVVVDFRDGYAVAMAAPGSGKTSVIVQRILALLSEGVRAADILSLTFTKEGAKEMTVRADLDGDAKVFSTFHSWALAFIKREYLALPFKVKTDWHGAPAPLCLPLDAARMLAQICRHLPDKVQWKDAQSFISRMKRRGVSPAMAHRNMENDGEEKFITAYDKYERSLREKGVLDFDSVVIETANLLKRREDVRERNQYRFIQIDEAQDTDAVQWSIIKAISSRHGNALAVGDENQGMYSWRGSESNLTEYFTSVFPDARIFALPVNYRSTKAIVEYCKGIAPSQNDTVTNLSTPNEEGIAPTFRLYPREDEEARAVILGCQDLSSTAILARTNRQLAAFENECAERNLRYKLLGKSGFWSQREVKDVVAIVGAVVKPTDANVLNAIKARCEATKYIRKSDSPGHDGAPTHLENMQSRALDKTSICSLLLRYDGEGAQAVKDFAYTLRDLRASVRSKNGKDGVREIIDRLGVLSAYDADDDKDENVDNDPKDNILKLCDYAARKGTAADFFEWTVKVHRALRARTDCLTLSTIHQSKGKEWPYVFVVGVNQDVLPHIKGDEQEERRIFFVACSRAAKRLHVSANGVASILIRDRIPVDTGDTINPWEGFELLQS